MFLDKELVYGSQFTEARGEGKVLVSNKITPVIMITKKKGKN